MRRSLLVIMDGGREFEENGDTKYNVTNDDFRWMGSMAQIEIWMDEY